MRELIKNIRMSWVIVALVITSLVMQYRQQRWVEGSVIKGRVLENYAVLPALLGLPGDNKAHDATSGCETEACSVCPNRLGMTLSYLPFFALAHVVAIISDQPADGYSPPYQVAVQLSSLVFIIIGLIFLHRILKILFPAYIATIAIICICFGSNMFYFLNMAGGSAHLVGFMLLSLFVYYTVQWHQDRDLRTSVILGIIGGLLALVRPADLWIFIFFALYEIRSGRSFTYKLKLYRRHIGQLSLIAIMTAGFYLFQLLVCRLGCESDCCVPQASEKSLPLSSLLGFRPSIFIYTPVLLFSVGGFFALGAYLKKFLLPCLAFFIVYMTAAFIWWNSPHSGSFGYRTLVDIYPVLALPFCALLFKMLNLGPIFRRLLYILIIVFISLNMWQTLAIAGRSPANVVHHNSGG
jgi:hypothetical protein